MEHSESTIDRLQRRLDEMEKRFERLQQQVAEQNLMPVRALAERDNQYPSTYDGLIKMMKRRGVPKRLASGAKKPKGSKAQTYVSLTELEAGEELATQSVKRDAGTYD